MNARQKAKRYKKLYESLIKQQSVNFQIHNFSTSIIKASTIVSYEKAEILQEKESIEVIKGELAQELAKELKEKMDISVDYYPESHIYKVYGTVRIVTGIY